MTGVADPVETGQRHQTVSQGDTTTPGFIPSPVAALEQTGAKSTCWCAKTLDLLSFDPAEGLGGCKEQIE